MKWTVRLWHMKIFDEQNNIELYIKINNFKTQFYNEKLNLIKEKTNKNK